jgi:hypothetical protein
MALAATILTAIGTVAALATVWLAYLALSKAKETVDEAKAARQDAEQAAKDAALERRAAAEDRRQASADRRAEEYARERRRLEHVGEVVEDLFWATYLARPGNQAAARSWMAQRNLLRHALVGLYGRLPQTANILNCATADQAVEPASQARQEIEHELDKLAIQYSTQQDEQSEDAVADHQG